MKADKDLYRELRALSADRLWAEEVPRFDNASPAERNKRVALIRAIGVVMAASGTRGQKVAARAWLGSLLKDPSEKIRRYAMAALPKIGVGETGERELLALLKPETGEREKKFLGRALEKIGGSATLEAVAKMPGLDAHSEQKVRAAVARGESPGSVRLDTALSDLRGVRIHLRCRKGLEALVRDEAKAAIAKHGKFRLLEFRGRCVALAPTAPFKLADLYSLRCFATLGFGLGVARARDACASADEIARIIASPMAQKVFNAFSDGSTRYRLEYVGKGHQRGAIRDIAARAFSLNPQILNDPKQAPWSIDLHATSHGISVELRPKLSPDPRLFYRKDDVWAASHPPLAACMARLAGPMKDDIIWDPFCGSGLELIECALLGGVKCVYGTDIDAKALDIARANFEEAKISNVQARFICSDFRNYRNIEALEKNSATLVITNPPMGRRIRVPNLHKLIEDLFSAAATVLKPGGRLVFPNPVPVEPKGRLLKLEFSQAVDLGGFECRLEKYAKQAI